MAWHDFIWKMQPAHLAFVLLLVSLLPCFVSLAFIPIPAGYQTKDFYNVIQNAPAGSVAAYAFDIYDIGTYYSGRDVYATVAYHMYKQHIKIIFVVLDTVAQIGFQDMMKRYHIDDRYGGTYHYGTDYIMTPYLPGEEIAMGRIADDVWAACADKDYFGTDFSALPMMASIHSFRDVWITYAVYYSGSGNEMQIRQWSNAKFSNLHAIGMANYPDVAYAYGTYFKGTLSTQRNSAEYEYLVNPPWPPEQEVMIDCRVTQFLVMMACIAIGAVHLQLSKRPKAVISQQEAKT
jgi:hypothetical protein